MIRSVLVRGQAYVGFQGGRCLRALLAVECAVVLSLDCARADRARWRWRPSSLRKFPSLVSMLPDICGEQTRTSELPEWFSSCEITKNARMHRGALDWRTSASTSHPRVLAMEHGVCTHVRGNPIAFGT